MLSLNFILSLLIVTGVTRAAPCDHHKNGTGASTTKAAKAIYFITNDAQNAVVALKVNADGTLSEGSTTLTGGQGASGIDGAKNTTAGPDALFSQSAVKADGNVNLPDPSTAHTDPPTDASSGKRRLQHRLSLQYLLHLRHDSNPNRCPNLHIRRLP